MSKVTFVEQPIDPCAPASGRVTVFAKGDLMYQIDELGVVTQLSSAAHTHVEADVTDLDHVHATLVYREGAADTGPTIFGAWAGIRTRLTTLRAVNSGGHYDIVLDNSVTESMTLPTGHTDMTNLEFVVQSPLFGGTGQWVTITSPEGATYTKLRKFRGPIEFINAATATTPCTDIVQGELFQLRDRARVINAAGAVPMYKVTLGVGEFFTIDMNWGAALNNVPGNTPVFDVAAVNTPIIFVGTRCLLNENFISGPASAVMLLDIRSTSAFVTEVLPGYSGTVTTNYHPHVRLKTAAVYTGPGTIPMSTMALADTSGGGFTLTLEEIANASQGGSMIFIKERSGSAGLLIDAFGAETIDGGAGTVAIAGGTAAIVINDDISNWDVILLAAGAEVNLTARQEAVTTQVITGSDTAITDTLNFTPDDSTNLILYLNGVMQHQGAGLHYTVSGTTITWLASSGTAVDMDTTDDLFASYWS